MVDVKTKRHDRNVDRNSWGMSEREKQSYRQIHGQTDTEIEETETDRQRNVRRQR